MVKPFLPDIIGNCFARVSAGFAARDVDPFEVFFDKGILPQVKRSVYLSNSFPLGWLVMKYEERFATNFAIHSEVDFQVILAMPTENTYTQQQREDISFKPRLVPIYEEFMNELQRERWFVTVGQNSIKHTRTLLPYWGLGVVNGPDVPNLFEKKFIDGISIDVRGLKIKRENCSGASYPVTDTSGYPPSSNVLTFYDDLELIVDAGQPTDPISGQSSVIIPFLFGKTYEVEQRFIGQLRQRREVEFIPDLVNGGFSLTNGAEFSPGDTYFIKIRPLYLP